jgi:queuosine precursor transporter
MLVANIIAVKILQIGPFAIPAGTIIFPISYIINNVLTEVYGFKVARRVIWMGFFANLFQVVVVYTALILPPAPFWDGQ